MLGIVLLILKIIGLILLGILGLFFALVLVVLFFPVSYRVWVQGDSREPEQLSCRVKILGIQVFPKKERKKKAQKQKEKKQAGAKSDKRRRKTNTPDTGEAKTGNAPAPESQTKPQPQAGKDTQTSGDHRAQAEGDNKKKQTGTEKQLKSPKKHKKVTSDKNIRDTLQQLWSEVTDEGNRKAFGHVCSEIKYFLRHFGPRRVEADVSFSMGDPANTGYVTAVLSLCPFPYGRNCEIIPDFAADQLYLCGWIDVRGHVRAVHVLVAGLRLLFDKNIRKIIRKILKKK